MVFQACPQCGNPDLKAIAFSSNCYCSTCDEVVEADDQLDVCLCGVVLSAAVPSALRVL